jgi:hypothetical protein
MLSTFAIPDQPNDLWGNSLFGHIYLVSSWVPLTPELSRSTGSRTKRRNNEYALVEITTEWQEAIDSEFFFVLRQLR